MPSEPRFFVVGGAGFIGSHLCDPKKLAELGWTVKRTSDEERDPWRIR